MGSRMTQRWKQVHQPEDPSWLEWHREVMSRRIGRSILKVWLSLSGDWRASLARPNGDSASTTLDDETEGDAKASALRWALAQ